MNLPTHLLLSRLGINYSDCPTEAQQVQRLDDAMTIIHAVQDGVHRTPGVYGSTWPTISAFDERLQENSAAMAELLARYSTGDLNAIHAQADKVNALREQLSFPEYIPPSDFELLQMAHTSAGDLARLVASDAAEGKDPIVLHPERALALLKQEVQPATISALTPAPVGIGTIQQAPAGDTVPLGAVITAPDGGRWQRRADRTPFGLYNYYVKVG